MALGDGAFVRALLDALVALLRHFASPTGARGSVLMMTGGLVVLGFLFLAFVFRSAIVGDLAPVANARGPLPKVRMPGDIIGKAAAAPPPRDFRAARHAARTAPSPTLDAVMEMLIDAGSDPRVLESSATRKRIRLYRCASCHDAGGAPARASARPSPSNCERERGLLAGGFESLTGQLAKVEEVACRRQGAPFCEFEVRHHALVRVRS